MIKGRNINKQVANPCKKYISGNEQAQTDCQQTIQTGFVNKLLKQETLYGQEVDSGHRVANKKKE